MHNSIHPIMDISKAMMIIVHPTIVNLAINSRTACNNHLLIHMLAGHNIIRLVEPEGDMVDLGVRILDIGLGSTYSNSIAVGIDMMGQLVLESFAEL